MSVQIYYLKQQLVAGSHPEREEKQSASTAPFSSTLLPGCQGLGVLGGGGLA